MRERQHTISLFAAILALMLALAMGPVAQADNHLSINEFVFNHTGTDEHEYVELFGNANTDYSAYQLLQIEGDSSSAGIVDSVHTVGTTDGNGFWWTDFLANVYENGTVSLLLVEGFSGSQGADLDADNDGTFDSTPWAGVVDAIAVHDGGSSDRAYGGPALTPGYDGLSFAPGGASRIPDGADTDSTSDWVRNDFDGAGLPGLSGSPVVGEAYNTPGESNAVFESDPFGACGDGLETPVHTLQGNGTASPEQGNSHVLEGVVVGDFQDTSTGLRGFFVQEEDSEADGDPATSEGIFVFDNGFGVDVNVGDVVRVQGTVAEFFNLTELTGISNLEICSGQTGTATAATVTLPVTSLDQWEQVEGMAVNIPQTLYVSDNFNQGRFGEVHLSVNDRLFIPTNLVEPGAPAQALQDLNERSRIQLDDGSNVQNPLPLPPYLQEDGTLRAGDTVNGLAGVVSYSFGAYEIHPVQALDFERVNQRPETPEAVGGSIQIASFNVLNYFTTLDNGEPLCGPTGGMDCRGAETPEEFEKQRAKIIAALSALDADIVGLIELENNASASIQDLVNGLNEVMGAETYTYIDTGTIGTDAIKVALIYKPASVTPVGDYAILDSSVDARFIDTKNRPALAQTFQENGTEDLVTVVVNHLKSKGSPCDDVGDPDVGDGQANCNQTRTQAAQALVDWLATDPTGSNSSDVLVMGDLNAYAMEDPVDVFVENAYTNLVKLHEGEKSYSYVFFGEAGSLDHALSSPSLTSRVTGATTWHINADEPRALDYNDFNQPAMFQPDPYRSSDHDPVIVGICETTSPEAVVHLSATQLWPPQHQYVDISATVEVTDADPDATVNLLSVTSDEPDEGLGDGDTPDDIVVVDDDHFKLRAERSATGDGRVYTVTYEVTDACGNSTVATATVTVPISMKP